MRINEVREELEISIETHEVDLVKSKFIDKGFNVTSERGSIFGKTHLTLVRTRKSNAIKNLEWVDNE